MTTMKAIESALENKLIAIDLHLKEKRTPESDLPIHTRSGEALSGFIST
jgi:hypothetical protein